MEAPPVWLLTTRGRGAAARAVVNACETAGMSSELVVYIDGSIQGYEWLAGSGIRWHCEPAGGGLAHSLEWCRAEYPHAAQYGWLADDTYPRTPAFDRHLEQAAGRFGLAYGYDGWLADSKLPEVRGGYILTAGLVWGGELVRTVGAWALPPGVKQAAIDHVWCRIITFLGLQRYQPSIVVEHHNWRTGKRPRDDTDAWTRANEAYVLRDIELADRFLASIDFRYLIARLRARMALYGPVVAAGELEQAVTGWQVAEGPPGPRSPCCLAKLPLEGLPDRCPDCGLPFRRYAPALPAIG